MLDIFNPIHNLKEMCKEFVLLEDHLQTPDKRCSDCIRKHLLKAEAFAEEAIGLDKTGQYLELLTPLPSKIRDIQSSFVGGTSEHDLGQQVRMLRKKLSPICFAANTKGGTHRKIRTKKKRIPTFILIARQLWPKNQRHCKDFKYLVWALKQNGPYVFRAQGVSAKIRNSPKWIVSQAVAKAKKGQLGRMVTQSLHSNVRYEKEDWSGAVVSDLQGGKRIALQTPSSSTGEILSDRKVRRKAVEKVVDNGQGEVLKRAIRLEKRGEFSRSAKMFLHIGKTSCNIYFLVKAANLYERSDDKENEALAFQEILKINPHHPLKFWLGNKIAMEEQVSNLPARYLVEEEEGSLNLAALGVVGFLTGIGIGLL
jgi:hypothetical protein